MKSKLHPGFGFAGTFGATVCAEMLSAYHLNGVFGNSGANSNGTVYPGGKFSEKRSAYYLNGIFDNSGANSNGTVHPGGKFSEKR